MSDSIKMIKETKKGLNLSEVTIPRELIPLQELLAARAHDEWVLEMLKQEWKFGPVHDESKKQSPLLMNYVSLSDGEKQIARDKVHDTIAVMIVYGYEITSAPVTFLGPRSLYPYPKS